MLDIVTAISVMVHGIDVSMVAIALLSAGVSLSLFKDRKFLICFLLAFSLAYLRHIVKDVLPFSVRIDQILNLKILLEKMPYAWLYTYRTYIADPVAIVIMSFAFYAGISGSVKLYHRLSK